MKLPLAPPPLESLIAHLGNKALDVFLNPQTPLPAERYLHWDEMHHRTPPEGLTHEQWWLGTKLARQASTQTLPLLDAAQRPFVFTMPEPVLRALHFIDRDAAGQILMDDPVTTPQDRDRYLISSLIEEAITSSQLEGASTTRRVAEDMLRAGRKPRDLSERMIFNNYQVMRHIRAIRRAPLTPAMVLELHRQVTEGTLDEPMEAGRLRSKDDVRVVDHRDGTLLHTPPPCAELPERLDRLCTFGNGSETETPYVHPVVRAILLHFMLAYDHPFSDGNGRTARALFYWSMARQDYWLMEYLSISSILRRAPAQYARAYLHTETDSNDTTYFILHQLDVIRQAVDALHAYLQRKTREDRATGRRLASIMEGLRESLNHRQIALLTHALKHRDALYTIESHRHSHAVAYATARSDLLHLAELGVLRQDKRGKTITFTVPDDLTTRLADRHPLTRHPPSGGDGSA